MELFQLITMGDKIYKGLAKYPIEAKDFIEYIPVVIKISKMLMISHKETPTLKELITYAEGILSQPKDVGFIRERQVKILTLMKKVFNRVLRDVSFNFYFYNVDSDKLPINKENARFVTELEEKPLNYLGNGHDISILFYDDTKDEVKTDCADIVLSLSSIISLKQHFTHTIIDVDYYTYTRFYLEAKLESLRVRDDIELLLAGSSYTQRGLFEKQMPVPSRNVAIDAQDIYYTLKTVRKSLESNSSIKKIVLPLPHYIWGVDISLSSSNEHRSRLREVNYQIFGDKHNFKDEIEKIEHPLLTPVSPFYEYIFDYKKWELEKEKGLHDLFKEGRYYLYTQEESKSLLHTEEENMAFAKEVVLKHGKTLNYKKATEENFLLFSEFLEEMNETGIEVIAYIPPMNPYYRKNVNKKIIKHFYEIIDKLKAKYKFKLINSYDCDEFETADFFDYDHLNDKGAKKLGKIISNEL